MTTHNGDRTGNLSLNVRRQSNKFQTSKHRSNNCFIIYGIIAQSAYIEQDFDVTIDFYESFITLRSGEHGPTHCCTVCAGAQGRCGRRGEVQNGSPNQQPSDPRLLFVSSQFATKNCVSTFLVLCLLLSSLPAFS